MPKHNDLTPEALDGYNGTPNRYLNSSSTKASRTGVGAHGCGRRAPDPRAMCAHPGYRMRVGDMLGRARRHRHGWPHQLASPRPAHPQRVRAPNDLTPAR